MYECTLYISCCFVVGFFFSLVCSITNTQQIVKLVLYLRCLSFSVYHTHFGTYSLECLLVISIPFFTLFLSRFKRDMRVFFFCYVFQLLFLRIFLYFERWLCIPKIHAIVYSQSLNIFIVSVRRACAWGRSFIGSLKYS